MPTIIASQDDQDAASDNAIEIIAEALAGVDPDRPVTLSVAHLQTLIESGYHRGLSNARGVK